MTGEIIKTKIFGVTKNNEDGSSRQKIIATIEKGMDLELIREPDNSYDPNAIAVFVKGYSLLTGYKLAKIGYTSSELAGELSDLMDMGEKYSCKVTDVTGGKDGLNYGVNILITHLSDQEDLDDSEHESPIIDTNKTSKFSIINLIV
jgi:hypothetical protein